MKMLTEDMMHDYQVDTVDWGMEVPHCMLQLGLGLGKTICAGSIMAKTVNQLEISRWLVIAPKKVCNRVWKQELAKWAHTKNLRVSIATGSARRRKQALEADADIYVINPENCVWLTRTFKASKWKWPGLCFDESSLFKSPKAKRFKDAMKHVVMSGLIRRTMLLTATPATSGLINLWTQMFLIDQGERLHKKPKQFELRYFKYNLEAEKLFPKRGAKESIAKKIADVTRVLRTRDYITLAEPTYNNIYIDLEGKHKEDYDDLEKKFYFVLENGQEVGSDSQLGLMAKLLQYSNGAIYVGDPELKPRPYVVVHDEKMDALEELVQSSAENLIVCYWFKSDLERLKKRFPDILVMDQEGEAEGVWNEGNTKLMAIHPQSAGHGLNLQHGGSAMVFLSLFWSLEFYLQTVGRIDRQGQEHPVTITHIITRGTIDEAIVKALRRNAQTQSELINFLKVENRHAT